MTKKKKVAIILPICIILLLGIALGIYFGLFYNKNKDDKSYYFTFSNGILISFSRDDSSEYIDKLEIPSSYSIDEQGHTVEGDDYVVTGIRYSVFKDKRGIGEIVLPDTIKTIGDEAFSGFWGKINLPTSLESIGDRAFYHTSITTINLPNVKSIGNEAFASSGLEEANVLSSLESIGDRAFYHTSITTINLPNVKSIGNEAFASSDLEEANFSSSFESLGEDVFADCFYFSQINIDENNPNYSSDQGVLYNKDKTELLIYPRNKQDTSFQVPQTVTKICERAFKYNSYLQSIVLSDQGLLSIENDAFYNCSALTSIKIPTTCSSIGDFAFYGCRELTKVDSENISQISIGQSAFENCYKLNDFKLSYITSLGERAFYNCQSLMSINLSNNYLEFGQSVFTNAPIIYNTYQNGQYLGNESNPYRYLVSVIDKDVSTFTINEGCVSICDNAFENCQNLTSITLLSGIVRIGDSAFRGCYSLRSVTQDYNLVVGMQSIGGYAFYGCENLTTVEIPNLSAEKIEAYTFYNCMSLEGFSLPIGVTNIGSYAFYNCKNLQYIPIDYQHSVLETIGSYAFAGCELVQSAYIPKSVKNIDDSAFKGCKALRRVEFEEGSALETIGYSAFEGCNRLLAITIPQNVTTISLAAFSGCDNLTDITIESEAIYSIVDDYNCGRLLANATTIKVYESFIQAGIVNSYIIQNFPANEISGEYRVFRKA